MDYKHHFFLHIPSLCFLPDEGGGKKKKPQIGLQIGHFRRWVQAENGEELQTGKEQSR